MNSCTALYTADYVLTQNEGRDIIEQGAIALAGDRILSVGHADILRVLYPDAPSTDMGRAAIMPGLINAHTHVSMSALRGYSDDKALMDWLTQDIFPIEDELTTDIIGTAAHFSFAEMIRSGTTAFYDMYMQEQSVFNAADSMGMRGVLGDGFTQFSSLIQKGGEAALFEHLREQAEQWAGHPRLRQAIEPHAPYTTNPQLLKNSHELAQELGALYGMHLAETQYEHEQCLKEHGLSPVAYCNSLGLLAPGSTFFHMVHPSAEDMVLLAEGRAAVVHCPGSNMKLASGIAPIGKLQSAGIPVALGTDGPASNNAQNMQREMYLASLLQKVHDLDPTACPAQNAIDLATRGGAAALHNPLIGSLEPGMKADFIAIDLSAPNMHPVHNIVSNLVYAANGSENILTVIDGVELYRDGKFTQCDYTALCAEMEGIRQWVQKQKKN